jgi:hypothetical protein
MAVNQMETVVISHSPNSIQIRSGPLEPSEPWKVAKNVSISNQQDRWDGILRPMITSNQHETKTTKSY